MYLAIVTLKIGDKAQARTAMTRKKNYDEQIKTFDGAIMMMEEQKMMVVAASSMREIFRSMKDSNKIMAETAK